MSNIIDGKLIAAKIEKDTAKQVANLKKKGIVPRLAVVLVGEDRPSRIYIKRKKEAAERVGMDFKLYEFPQNIKKEDLIKNINQIQKNKKLSGLIVQLPLPERLYVSEVLNAINPKIDVDCLTDNNIGKLVMKTNLIEPPTPWAVIHTLKETGINLVGKNVTIIGMGALVGKPLAIMMANELASVTTCNSHTKNIKKKCLEADIIVNVLSFSSFFKPFGVTVGLMCEKLNKPYVPWIHTTIQNSKFNNIFGVNDYVQKTALYLTSEMLKGNMCRGVIAVSSAVKESVVSFGVDPEKVRVVYNGLNVEKILNDVRDITEKASDVICIQRLSAEKSSTLTVAVLANLKKLVPDFKGVLVGEGYDKDIIMSLIKIFGLEKNIKIVSKLGNGDLTKEIARSKAFLSTSLTESFGLAIAESMLVGTSVVVPDIEGPKEITESGKCGFVFENTDTIKPAQILADLMLKNPGPEIDLMKKKAKEKAVKEFDIKIQGKKVLDLLWVK